MKTKSTLLHRTIRAGLALHLLATHMVFASPSQPNFWWERRAVPTVRLEAPFLKPLLLDPSPPPADSSLRTVFHIQDIHLHAEAQAGIKNSLHSLLRRHRVGIVALEGAFGPVDLSSFRAYPHQESVRGAADYLFEQKRISGVMHAAFTSTTKLPPFLGVDDAFHYEENVNAYRVAAPLQSALRETLFRQNQELQNKKEQIFSVDLRKFDAQTSAYREGRLPLSAYVRVLLARPAASAARGNMVRFLQALELESKLDFGRAEKERSETLARLAKRLSASEAKSLAELARLHGEGAVDHAEFYRRFARFCERKGLSLDGAPSLRTYFEYADVAGRIDGEKLFEEVTGAEAAGYAALAVSDAQKTLVAETRRLVLTAKLLDFALSSREWADYNRIKIDGPSELRPFEKFYIEAEARDAAMARNLLAAMEKKNATSAILIAGGFHSKGIAARLAEAGVRTVSITPQFRNAVAGDGSSYLSAFVREQTPLEKIFEGQKLFVVPPVDTPQIRGEAGVLTMALEAQQGRAREAQNYFSRIASPLRSARMVVGRLFNRSFVVLFTRRGIAVALVSIKNTSLKLQEMFFGWPRFAAALTSGIRTLSFGENRGKQVLFRGNLSTVLASLAEFDKASGRRDTLGSVIHTVAARYPLLPLHSLIIELGSGNKNLARVKNGVLFIEFSLLDFPLLLEQELNEEFHHLFLLQMVTDLDLPKLEPHQLALEELMTDLLKIKSFARLSDPDLRYSMITPLIQRYEGKQFAKILLRALNPGDRLAVIDLLKTRAVINERFYQELAMQESFRMDLLGNDEEDRIRALMALYTSMEVYGDLTDYFRSHTAKEVTEDLAVYRAYFRENKEKMESRNTLPPVALGEGISLQLFPGMRVITSRDNSWEALNSLAGPVGQIVAVAPHPDDVAIGVGAFFSSGLPKKNLRLVTVTNDTMGVTKKFAESEISGSGEKLEVVKKTIRHNEDRAYAERYVPSQRFTNLNIDFPVEGTIKQDGPGGFNPLEHKFMGPTPDDQRKVDEYVEEVISQSGNNALFLLPYPFLERDPAAPAELLHHAHPMHAFVASMFLRSLRRFNFMGTVVFYQTPERIMTFKKEGLTPNLVYAFDEERMNIKVDGIEIYRSQNARKTRGLDDYPTAAKKRNLEDAAGRVGNFPFAELMMAGRLSYPDTADKRAVREFSLGRVRAIILAGGKSYGLWPISKLFVSLGSNMLSVIRHTFDRLAKNFDERPPFISPENTYVVGSPTNGRAVRTHLDELPSQNLLAIPDAESGDLNGILWALANAETDDAPLIIVPGDTVINRPHRFREIAEHGLRIAAKSPRTIVMLGQRPPADSSINDWMRFGSIHASQRKVNGSPAYYADKFIEKPDRSTAEMMKASGEWTWNMAVVIGQRAALEGALKETQPAIYEQYLKMVEMVRQGDVAGAKFFYQQMSRELPHPLDPSNTIRPIWDYHVTMPLLKLNGEAGIKIAVISTDLTFHDIGNWEALVAGKIESLDESGIIGTNAYFGDGELDLDEKKVHDCIIYAEQGKKVLIRGGVRDLIVAFSLDGSLLVTPRTNVLHVKQLIQQATAEKALRPENGFVFTPATVNTEVVSDSPGIVLVAGVANIRVEVKGNSVTILPLEPTLEDTIAQILSTAAGEPMDRGVRSLNALGVDRSKTIAHLGSAGVHDKIREAGPKKWWEWARVLLPYTMADRVPSALSAGMAGKKQVFIPVAPENIFTLKPQLMALGRSTPVRLLLSDDVPAEFEQWAKENLARFSVVRPGGVPLYTREDKQLILNAARLEEILSAIPAGDLLVEESALAVPEGVLIDTELWREAGSVLSRMEIRLLQAFDSFALPIRTLQEIVYYARLLQTFA